MKIKGTCRRDGREILADQVIASGGECPWDGEPFNADYAVTLVDALRDAAGRRQRARAGDGARRRPHAGVHPGRGESIFGNIRALRSTGSSEPRAQG